MATKTKTFKLGEVCRGGIITVEVTGKLVVIIGKEWVMSQETSRGSNQSNAKEFTRGSVMADERNAYRKIDDFLNDLTTSYYSGKIIEYIESIVPLKEKNFWE